MTYHPQMNRIDHLVVAAASLEQGVDYICHKLGVDIPKGGHHQTMGTHNHLMQLGDQIYLEVISIDPAAIVPAHPRWFGLDQSNLREALQHQPRLITWVMNTRDLAQTISNTSFDLGQATTLSRDLLRWRIALPDDGRLLAGGLLPYCIQWLSQPHPSTGMANLGCSLQQLRLHHNRCDWLVQRLNQMGAHDLVEVVPIDDDQAPWLSATIKTPTGVITF